VEGRTLKERAVVGGAARGRRLRRSSAADSSPRRYGRFGVLFTSPALLVFLVFWLVPFGLTIYYSLTDWDVGGSAAFVGLDNYVHLLEDGRFHRALIATAWISGVSLVGMIGLALLLAAMLNKEGLVGGRFFRVAFIAPVVTDWVSAGLVWQLMFLPDRGVLAGIFHSLGLGGLAGLEWTTDGTLAPFAISIFIVWKVVGFYTVILLAGMRSIPRELLEAAAVDGANAWHTYIGITLPLLRPLLLFVIIHGFVLIVGLFEPVFMLTGGGPAEKTRTLPLFLYDAFFRYREGGYASAAALVYLVLSVGFASLMVWRVRTRAY
jgi:ABC-type sugar transport system permease subunit